MKSVFAVQGRGWARLSALLGGLRRSVAGACGAAVFALMWCAHAQAAVLTPPAAECSALQAKYPQFKGKTLINAINPHTPGYETVDPADPSKYIGFDIDLGETIGACLGFNVDYKPVAFAALLPTLQAKQADFVISDIYATEERAKAADFVTYSKVFDGVLVATAAENTGYVEVPLIQALAPTCKAQNKAEAQVQLYDNNQNAIEAILAGRADTYINDVNTVDGAVKAYPTKLEKATAVTIPYSVGIAVPKGDLQMRAAIVDALGALQKSGVQTALLKKNNLPVENLEAPQLVLAK